MRWSLARGNVIKKRCPLLGKKYDGIHALCATDYCRCSDEMQLAGGKAGVTRAVLSGKERANLENGKNGQTRGRGGGGGGE